MSEFLVKCQDIQRVGSYKAEGSQILYPCGAGVFSTDWARVLFYCTCLQGCLWASLHQQSSSGSCCLQPCCLPGLSPSPQQHTTRSNRERKISFPCWSGCGSRVAVVSGLYQCWVLLHGGTSAWFLPWLLSEPWSQGNMEWNDHWSGSSNSNTISHHIKHRLEKRGNGSRLPNKEMARICRQIITCSITYFHGNRANSSL